MKKVIGGRFAWCQPSEKRPRTKDDDDEKDSDMTLNRYLTLNDAVYQGFGCSEKTQRACSGIRYIPVKKKVITNYPRCFIFRFTLLGRRPR
jgi:hypothetical protein